MHHDTPAAARPFGASLRALFLVAAALATTGCATHFVDAGTKDVPAADFARPARPTPAQVVFEFQTKGVPNARATEHLKSMAVEGATASGLFSSVSEAPAPGAGLLSVTLNNVPITDDAAAKGFMTGLTFGLAGSTVTDGYICTVSYLAPGSAKPVVTTSRHAIHTSLGNAGAPPPGAYKASGIEDAVRTMTRQAMANALRDLSREPGFR